MKLLITPREVLEIAFAGSPSMSEEVIAEATIVAAQQKFIRPVVGKIYAELEKNRYPELHASVKDALAHYVKLLMLPKLAVSVGNFGIVQSQCDDFKTAQTREMKILSDSVRSEACALMRKTVEYIEANEAAYPEYDKNENVLNRVSICSGIVI